MTQNRLAKEKSPYLLQHADNPVDWYPWSEEAFEKAKSENKPVFLSIGYSTCHWCHVMEHESFEDEEVAGVMNDAFVSIKVDREERPDIDGIYMAVCQMLTGSGGWPLTIIMTPDKKPFFAGTYFPKENRFGKAGMLEIIPQIKEFWLMKKEEVLRSAEQISSALSKAAAANTTYEIDEKIFDRAFNDFKKSFDSKYGGFGHSPKFPTPHNLLFLLRYWKRTGNNEALEMVKKTLIEMRRGGIFDHIGFGFHRYSTDEQWLVPHFEKMLYDQALLSIAYIEIYQVTKEEVFKNTAEEILEYVLRDMTSPEGGFYSAEDADSEGVEGKFYLWNEKEIGKILGGDADIFIKIFNVDKAGNMPALPTGRPAGQAEWIVQSHESAAGTNILHLVKSVDEYAKELDFTPKELEEKIESARKKLFQEREKRIHPYKDDKILTDWNGLMISALSKAAQVFNEQKYSDAAEKAITFIQRNLVSENGRLMHRFRNGEAGLPAHIDDYAFVIAGLLDLYEAVFNVRYLKLAIELQKTLIALYSDDINGGFYFTSEDGEKLLVRQKEIYDGAIPSGNSVALLNLLRLNRISGNSDYADIANKLVKTFSGTVSNSPAAFTQFLCGLDFAFGPTKEIVVAGKTNNPLTEKMLNLIHSKFLPDKILLFKDVDKKEICEVAGFTKSQGMIGGKTTVYVCENYSCKIPVTDLPGLDILLK